jgi:hypothetical protein
MVNYVIDRICGTAPPDGGAALKRNAEASRNGNPLSTWGGEGHADAALQPAHRLTTPLEALIYMRGQ